MKRVKYIIWVFSGILFLLSACKNNQGNEQNMEQFKYADEDAMTSIEVTKSFVFLFPSPGEVLERFYEADISYMGELLHPSRQSDKYLTSKDKALNLGVYISDMAYSAMFSRTNETVDYLKTIQRLSSEIDISNNVFESLIERAEGSIGDRDSMVVIGNEVFYNMVEFLETGGKEHTVAVISCGAYVEAMYLALNSVDEFNEDDPVIKQIAELKYPMENLKNQAESVSNDPGMESIVNYLNMLDEVFQELQKESMETTAKQTGKGTLTLSGGPEIELNEDNFSDLKSRVFEIRESIVGQ